MSKNIEIPDNLALVTDVRAVLAQTIREFSATPEDTLLAKARTVANDPTIFDDHKPFFWAALASNDRIDSHFTMMAVSSLQNYAADAVVGADGAGGVAFVRAHARGETNIGWSLTGAFLDSGAEGQKRFIAEFYTIPGLGGSAGFRTDDLILGIRSGVFRDVSIGFKRGEGFSYTCSVCGLDYWDWDCYHVGGETYDVKGDDGVHREVLCYSLIDNARLSEVSVVYDGSTPDAQFLKAQREIEAGRASAATIDKMRRVYNLDFGKKSRALASPESSARQPAPEATKTRGEKKMADEVENAELDNYRNSLRTVAEEAMRTAGLEIEGTIKPDAVLRALATAVSASAPAAADGKRFKAEVVDAAIAQGKRAFGKDFDEAGKRALLEKNGVDEIRSYEQMWKQSADKAFGGGRKTADTPETDENREKSGAEGEESGKQPNKTLQRKANLPKSAYQGA